MTTEKRLKYLGHFLGKQNPAMRISINKAWDRNRQNPVKYSINKVERVIMGYIYNLLVVDESQDQDYVMENLRKVIHKANLQNW